MSNFSAFVPKKQVQTKKNLHLKFLSFFCIWKLCHYICSEKFTVFTLFKKAKRFKIHCVIQSFLLKLVPNFSIETMAVGDLKQQFYSSLFRRAVAPCQVQTELEVRVCHFAPSGCRLLYCPDQLLAALALR